MAITTFLGENRIVGEAGRFDKTRGNVRPAEILAEAPPLPLAGLGGLGLEGLGERGERSRCMFEDSIHAPRCWGAMFFLLTGPFSSACFNPRPPLPGGDAVAAAAALRAEWEFQSTPPVAGGR